MEIVETVNDLANQGKRVIIAGLDQDYIGKTVRADAAAFFHRRIYHENSRHLRQMRLDRQLFTAHI